jgi:phenylalanyl-tRNA synthetase beta chain
MPDGTRLKKAKLRGQESRGMILAEDEVGIGTDHDGIMVLADELGRARRSPTCCRSPPTCSSSRSRRTGPDCLGVYGVAREVHAATGAPLAPPPWARIPARAARSGRRGRGRGPDLCPRFTARLFEDVTIGPSPRG